MNLKEFFLNEVKPALGCTEPGAVALAAASAAKYMNKEPERIHLELSGNIYKNGANVGVPGTNGGTGNPLASILGVLAGDPTKGLKALENITMDDVVKAQAFVDAGNVTQEVAVDVPNVYARVTLDAGDEKTIAVLSGRHDNVVEVSHNGEVVYSGEEVVGAKKKSDHTAGLKDQDMASLWELASSISDEVADYLLEGRTMNMDIAGHGLEEPWGLGVGYYINKINDDDLLYKIKAYAGAAADARMGGGPWPVMSSAGSGNHGITAILPPTLYAKVHGKSDRELAEALALSHLVTRYIKVYTGLLTPICGCAVAAGAGAAAAITRLSGGTPKQAEVAVAGLMASLMGMTCDGGKGSCAFKVSTAAGEAYLFSQIALMGGGVTQTQGILKPDLVQVSKVLGEVSDKGMSDMDETILRIIQRE
ncbi:MAG: L-serine ammonia-lyase, iron-sulfur-dependent, subunit alpha [Candidatus Bathyarchaeota archaeon]|nr:L-serine ammonia-lyase, iron-sulfur-dependent, subunit alpha [Candidatus Bathyarchaeota archaeon]